MNLLDHLTALEAATTKGPWVNPDGYCVRHEDAEPWQPVCRSWGPAKSIEQQVDNMEFIAESRNHMPALLRLARAAVALNPPLDQSRIGTKIDVDFRAVNEFEAARAELLREIQPPTTNTP